MTRKRGAQPGNANAIKHGFYSQRFTRLELDDLDKATLDHLLDAVLLLKVVGRRVVDMAQSEEPDFEAWLKALETLGRTQVRIASLLRSSSMLRSKADDVLYQHLLKASAEAEREEVY